MTNLYLTVTAGEFDWWEGSRRQDTGSPNTTDRSTVTQYYSIPLNRGLVTNTTLDRNDTRSFNTWPHSVLDYLTEGVSPSYTSYGRIFGSYDLSLRFFPQEKPPSSFVTTFLSRIFLLLHSDRKLTQLRRESLLVDYFKVRGLSNLLLSPFVPISFGYYC